MKKSTFDNVDVIVIQKQTALERYTNRDLNIDFLDYLSQDNQGREKLNFAHDSHVKSRNILIHSLNKLNMSYVMLNLDELKQNKLNFFDEKLPHSGLMPKQKLVISLGGDGTLLHASHHVGGDVELLGINSCPQHSVGHLCAIHPCHTLETLGQILIEKKRPSQLVKRLRVKLSNNTHNVPLALNDILISHKHPAATSRYQISILNTEGHVVQSEKQLSSGLWISTAAGSTAAIASYGLPAQALTSHKLLLACREPYAAKGENMQLNKFTVDGQTHSLSIFSRMRQGMICLDGQILAFFLVLEILLRWALQRKPL